MFKRFIENSKEELIRNTCELINIPSVYNEENSKFPFGENTVKALEYILNLGNEMGFKTKNLDNYCGYIEFGEGEELVGIIGHLDVVPAKNDWKYEPFNSIIKDGKIYGRGAIDDKGPVMASLYAMNAVKNIINPNKRVRLILGLDEERTWKCIEYYKQKEQLPNIGFSPDANFPCVYAEKSMLSVKMKQDINNDKIKIENIDCDNNAINVVPKYCKVNLKIDNCLDINEVCSKIDEIIKKYEYNIKYEKNNDVIELISYGVASHSARPELGINAITRMIILLNELFEKYNINIEILKNISQKINIETNGKSMGINCIDESGELTLNLSQFSLENSKIEVGINIRIPVKTTIDEIKDKIKIQIKQKNVEVEFFGEKPALYIPKDSFLVKKMCNIYNSYMDDNKEAIAMGGGTYARAFENCISFGSCMPGKIDMCHQADEYIEIQDLIDACNMYAIAIYELTK